MSDLNVEHLLKLIKVAVQADDWTSINAELSTKRIAWYKKEKDALNLAGTDVRKAYSLILQKIGINPKEAPVVYEDLKKIVWRSKNYCPVLEACIEGGFDTRLVCRKGWEESVQLLVGQINPHLRFSRDYGHIRPHSTYCEESISLP